MNRRRIRAQQEVNPPELNLTDQHRSAQAKNECGQSPWTPVIFLIFCAVYWFYFFRQPVFGNETTRLDPLLSALIFPTEFVELWFGGPGGHGAILDRSPILLVATLILAAGLSLGRLLLEFLQVDVVLTRLERIVLAVGIGCNLLSLGTLLLGTIGCLDRYFFSIALFSILIVGAGRYYTGLFSMWGRRFKAPGRVVTPGSDATRGSVERAAVNRCSPILGLVLPFAGLVLLGSFLPPVDFDVREYHLQVPKEWYQQGRIAFLPHNIYGNMPMGSEMLSLLAMVLMPGEHSWWWGALAGKTVIGLFAVLGAMILYAAGRRFVSAQAGAVAAVVYVSVPWVGHVSMHGLVDVVWGFYFFTAFYTSLIWSQLNVSVPRRTRGGVVAVAGFLAGAAVSCKYPSVLMVVIPIAGLIWFASRWKHWFVGEELPATAPSFKASGGATLVFLLAVLCGSGPWFVKNAVWTGNPTYPLLYGVFGGETRNPEKHEQWSKAHAPPGFSWKILIDDAQRMTLSSRWLSPLLLPLVVFGLVSRPHRRFVYLLLLLVGYYAVIWWGFTHRIDRFWVPALPLLALIAGIGTVWVRTRLAQCAVAIVVAAGLLTNGIYISSLAADPRFFVPLSSLVDDPLWIKPAHRYFNSARFTGEKVLLVGDAEPFDLRVPVLYNTCFDDCIFEHLIQGKTPSQQVDAFREAGITHIYVDWAEIERYRNTYGFSDFVQSRLLDELQQNQILRTDTAWGRWQQSNGSKSTGTVYEVVF